MRQAWTVAGDPTVEKHLDALGAELAVVLKQTLTTEQLVTAAVIGGYGRGEGGVEKTGTGPAPHNNVDLLVVSKRPLPTSSRADVAKALRRLENTFGVSVDAGWVTAKQLRSAPPRVMWCDVRFGHRVILGSETFLAGLTRFRTDNIRPMDVLDLVTNRGALLVLSKLLLGTSAPSDWARREAVKGAMKATVGIGDALLLQNGRYRVSYSEKARLVASSSFATSTFRQHYAEAIRFRFRPDYHQFAGSERQWLESVSASFEDAHRRFTRTLLGPAVEDWSAYESGILRYCLRNRGVRGWTAFARDTFAQRHQVLHRQANLWASLSLERHRVAASLARTLYAKENAPAKQAQFIEQWSRACDINFPDRVAQELHLGTIPCTA